MKILKYFEEKIKRYKEEIFLVCIILLAGLLGFGLGRVSKLEERKVPIRIEEGNSSLELSENKNEASKESSVYFIASRNGKKYYFPWCSGADRISQNNIIKFNTRDDAENAGYEKATNCPGL